MFVAALAVSSLLAGLSAKPTDVSGSPVRADGIAARVWTSARLGPSPRLVIVLHGDLAGARDNYQYTFARLAADRLRDSIVIAALRPGYADPSGARSSGRHGLATGDNYTPEAIGELKSFIQIERNAFHASSVTLVGHSGGAALSADLVEDYHDLASRLLLVSCPCDLQKWRAHMAVHQLNPLWLIPVESQSPMQEVGRLPPGLRLGMVVGEQDVVAPVQFSVTFARAARSIGVHASLAVLPGAGHNILLDPRVMQALVSLQAAR